MRKLTLVLTALAFSATPVVGQVEVRAFTWQGGGTFENLTCARADSGDYCFYSQGNGALGTTGDYVVYPLAELTPPEGADLCWLIGQPGTVRGALATPQSREWIQANMVGRTFCVYFAPGMVVDVGDGMEYLRDPAAERTLTDMLNADDTPAPEGGLAFPRT